MKKLVWKIFKEASFRVFDNGGGIFFKSPEYRFDQDFYYLVETARDKFIAIATFEHTNGIGHAIATLAVLSPDNIYGKVEQDLIDEAATMKVTRIINPLFAGENVDPIMGDVETMSLALGQEFTAILAESGAAS